jgi:hypothetical protein
MEEQNPVPEKTKKLPKWLTTVTPLSKALAMILFIALPFIGFYLGMKYQQQIMINPPVVSEVQKNIIPTPTSASSKNIDGTIACKTNRDCPSGYSCTQAGPIKYNPETKKTSPGLNCWKNNVAVPL